MEFDHSQSYPTVEHPYLTSLDIMFVHIDYIEQFLHESKTRLPELRIKYDQLPTVTENFTRNVTRLNCMKVKRLILESDLHDDDGNDEMIVQPQDFDVYFPLL